MKHKYVTIQTLLACNNKKQPIKVNVRQQISETLLEREGILEKMKRQSRLGKVIDMYLQEYQVA